MDEGVYGLEDSFGMMPRCPMDPHEWKVNRSTMPSSSTCIHCGVFKMLNTMVWATVYQAANGWIFGAVLPQCRRNQGRLPRRLL